MEYTVLLWPKWKEYKRWEIVFTVLAGLAIAGGVYGEYLFGSRAAAAGLKIENISESRVADLNAQAAALNGQAARLAKEAANAEIELAKLKAPRSLTEAQQRELVSELKPFDGTEVLVAFSTGDMEAFGIAAQLMAVLGKAGWKLDLNLNGRTALAYQQMAEHMTGISVSRISGLKLPTGATVQPVFAKAADALSKALQKLGLLNIGPGGIHSVTDNPNEEVVVVVGRKL